MAESTLANRLQLKAGMRLLVINVPGADYAALAGALPDDITVSTEAATGPFDAVHLFVHTQTELADLIAGAIAALKPGGLLWISYPKLSGKIRTDISRDRGWGPLAAAGFQPVRQIGIDETWSALRFRKQEEVRRRGGQPVSRW